MTQRLVFNADDYGISPGVSAGIRDATRGVVRSTTVMANLATDDDMAALTKLDISVGLHLNLSCGPPLSKEYPHELLLPSGWFDKKRALNSTTWRHPEYRLAAWKEWQAQLVRARDTGIEPDHLDSHHHVHLIDPLWGLAMQLAEDLGVGIRTRTAQRDNALHAGLFTPDTCVESYFGYNISRDDLLAALQPAPDGMVEVMCHPGYVDDLLRGRSAYLSEREQELAVLGCPSLRHELELNGWVICKYEPA